MKKSGIHDIGIVLVIIAVFMPWRETQSVITGGKVVGHEYYNGLELVQRGEWAVLAFLAFVLGSYAIIRFAPRHKQLAIAVAGLGLITQLCSVLVSSGSDSTALSAEFGWEAVTTTTAKAGASLALQATVLLLIGMFRVPEAEKQSFKYSELVQWVLVSTVGGLVGNSIATNAATSWEMECTLFGAGMGIMQWFILRQQISRAGWWVLATTIGGAVGLAADMKLFESGILIGGGVLIGASMGILQWFVLRRQIPQSGWWVLASTAGWVIGWPTGYAIAPGTASGMGVTFAIAAAITGIFLVWLLQHPVSVGFQGEAMMNLRLSKMLTLQDGIAAAEAGDREHARAILQEILSQDPRNEMAWLWLTTVVDQEQAIQCLEAVLEINPANQHAQIGLAKLRAGSERTAQPTQPAPKHQAEEPSSSSMETLQRQPQGSRKHFGTAVAQIGILLALGLGCVLNVAVYGLWPFSMPALWVSPVDGAEMVYVPAGEFLMGTNEAEIDNLLALCKVRGSDCKRADFDDERPQHTVYLDAFYIDRTEVTNAQYQKCVEAGACRTPTGCDFALSEPTYGDAFKADYPVSECVRWEDAEAYCEWAGRRLPTEAEWEKAARGTDGRMYPWGNTFDGSKLNFCDKNCWFPWKDTSVDDGYMYTAPVGSYPEGASSYGVLDMAGNAWEWVADWYDSTYYRKSPGRNPSGLNSGEERVQRGGSWYNGPFGVRCATRGHMPADAYGHGGFRCARDSE